MTGADGPVPRLQRGAGPSASVTEGGTAVKNAIRMGASVALAGALLAMGAGSAWASDLWVPPSWVTVAAGDPASARASLGGAPVSVVAGSGWTYADPPDGICTGGGLGCSNSKPVGVNGSITWQVDRHCGDACWGADPPHSPTDGELVTLTADYAPETCSSGLVQGSYASTSIQDGTVQDLCPAGDPLVSVTVKGWPTWGAHVYQSTLSITGGSDVTTTLTCRAADGTDTEVSETASGSAPSPVCPAGTTVVRIRVTQGDTVLQDSSISTNWSHWQDYVGGGGGFALPGVGGVPCIIGMLCSITPWWQSPDPPPANADCWLMSVNGAQWDLQASDCQTANKEGAAKSPEGTGETTTGTDLNPLMRLLEGLASGVTKAVNAVRSAVDAVRSAIQGVGSAIQKTINSVVDRIIEAINGVKQAVEAAGKLIGDLLKGLGSNGSGSGGQGGGGSEGPAHDLPSGPGPIASPLGQWTSLLGGLGSGFSESGTCEGPALHLSLADQDFTLHLLDACGERATLAGWSRIFITVGLVGTVLLSTIRVVSSAIGLQLRGGE